LERSDIKFRLIPNEEKTGRKTTKEGKFFLYIVGFLAYTEDVNVRDCRCSCSCSFIYCSSIPTL